MKLKEQKKLGILYLVLGAALFLVGLLTDADEKTNWLSSFGSAIAVVGAARLLRVYRLTRDPDKAADYDASLTDERAAYAANKARSMALYICIYVQLAAALAAILIFKQTLSDRCSARSRACRRSSIPVASGTTTGNTERESHERIGN